MLDAAPSDSPPEREVCEEFVAHEFLTLKGHPMCATCTHLRDCHLVMRIAVP